MRLLKFPLVIAIMVIAVAGTFAANYSTAVKIKMPVVYHYVSSSGLLTEMQKIENWVEEDPSCSSSGSKPCGISYEGDINAFDSYLQGFTDAADVTAAAFKRKN